MNKVKTVYDHIRSNNIKSVMVVRMEVPCCGGTVAIVREALARAGRELPVQVVVVGADGGARDEESRQH